MLLLSAAVSCWCSPVTAWLCRCHRRSDCGSVCAAASGRLLGVGVWEPQSRPGARAQCAPLPPPLALLRPFHKPCWQSSHRRCLNCILLPFMPLPTSAMGPFVVCVCTAWWSGFDEPTQAGHQNLVNCGTEEACAIPSHDGVSPTLNTFAITTCCRTDSAGAHR